MIFSPGLILTPYTSLFSIPVACATGAGITARPGVIKSDILFAPPSPIHVPIDAEVDPIITTRRAVPSAPLEYSEE